MSRRFDIGGRGVVRCRKTSKGGRRNRPSSAAAGGVCESRAVELCKIVMFYIVRRRWTRRVCRFFCCPSAPSSSRGRQAPQPPSRAPSPAGRAGGRVYPAAADPRPPTAARRPENGPRGGQARQRRPRPRGGGARPPRPRGPQAAAAQHHHGGRGGPGRGQREAGPRAGRGTPPGTP